MQATTLLQQLDPRLKLILLSLLIAASFSADSLLRLLVLTGISLWFSHASEDGLRLWWQVIRPLRILLLVTLLLHLGFSSGWTLFGQTWLSLDGLQLGLLTCWRLVVAVSFALLLTRSTPVEELAAAIGAIFSPLKRIGYNPEVLVEFVLLTLAFVPLLQTEAAEQLQGSAPAQGRMSSLKRLKYAAARIEPLILSLADRGELLAARLVRGERLVSMPTLGRLRPLPGGWLTLCGGLLLLLLLFSM